MPDNGCSSEETIIKPNKGRNPRNPRKKSENRDRSPQREARPPRFSRELSVLYEDHAVVALNKPPGLLSVPIKDSKTPSALSLLSDYLKPRRERAHIVHRIDRFVSGILLFAKTSADRDDLVEQFLEHTPVRQYLAIVRGHLDKPSETLVHYFRREAMFQQLRTKRDPNADRAELRYIVEREFARATLVRVELETGLQNQIRAQFAAIGHPVIGDRKYSPDESLETLISRVALHSAHLEFVHPRTGESVSLECEPPADFQYLVRELGKSR